MKLSSQLEENLSIIRHLTGDSADTVISRVTVCGIACALLSCEGMCSSAGISEQIAEPLHTLHGNFRDGAELLHFLRTYRLFAADSTAAAETGTLLHLLHSGFVILLAEGAAYALACGLQGYASRGISEPSGELNIYGAKEGFTEPIRTNMSLIRRRMKTPLLTFELSTAGTLSQTDLCMVYLRDRVPEDLLQKVRDILKDLPLESILSGGYVRPFLEGSDFRLVHSVGTTERPDILCAKLMEGRVGILIDGTPFALLLPQLFCETFQTLDDYNYPPLYATLLRWIKYAAALIALLLPAGYLAAAVHHPELLHETLLRLLDAQHLEFHSLISCPVYAYMWKQHPLAGMHAVTLDELAAYPCLTFEQGDKSSFYFAEEIFNTTDFARVIKACDRSTMLNLMKGLEGYTFCSGIICNALNGSDYTAVPIAGNDSTMEIGYITRKNVILSDMGRVYLEELQKSLEC